MVRSSATHEREGEGLSSERCDENVCASYFKPSNEKVYVPSETDGFSLFSVGTRPSIFITKHILLLLFSHGVEKSELIFSSTDVNKTSS